MGAQVAISERSLRPALVLRPVLGSRPRPWATSLALVAADFVAIFLARAAAVMLWNRFHPALGFANILGFWPSAGLLAMTYAALGLYTGGMFAPVEELRRAVVGTIFVCLVLTAAQFFLQHTGPYSRGHLLLSGCLTAVAVPLTRSLARQLFARRNWWGVP